MSSEAYVTLATTDDYALGALVLAQSIRKTGTKRNLVVLITNQLSDLIRETLKSHFDEVIVVEELNSNDDEHLQLLSRPELGMTFTKINCWLLEQYSKCVFLDSDTLVLRNIDDLFQREELSAAADAGWPDCFNSGVFVYRPSKETFRQLVSFSSQENSSFDGGDQGLLNRFFSDWSSGDISRHLPFTYNVTSNAFYSYLPAVTRFRNDIHVLHFAGSLKPWQLTYNPQNQQLSGNLSGQSDIQREFLLSWWTLMYQQIWPQLSKTTQAYHSKNQSSVLGGGSFAGGYVNSLSYGNESDNQGVEVGSVAHRRAWEAGYVDYSGRDSFSNIQEQIDRNIAQKPLLYNPSQQRETPSTPQTTSLKQQTTQLLQPVVDETTTFVRQTVVTQTTAHLPPTVATQSTTDLPTPVVTQTTRHLPSTVTTQSTTHASQPNVKETTTYLPTSVATQSTTNLPTPTVPQTTTHLPPTPVATQSTTDLPTPVVTQTTRHLPATVTTQSTTHASHPNVKETTTHLPPTSVTTKSTTDVSHPHVKETATAYVPPVEVTLTSTYLPQTVVEKKTSHLPPVAVTQTTTHVPSSVIIQSTTPPPQTLFKETSTTHLPSSVVTQSATHVAPVAITQTTTHLSHNVVTQSSAPFSSTVGTQSTTPLSSTFFKESLGTGHLSQSLLKEPMGSSIPTTGLLTQITPTSSAKLNQSSTSSSRLNDSLSSTSDHESNWKVKSTIVTAYTQGAGVSASPTVVSKVVSETVASSDSDVATVTTTDQNTDSIHPPGSSLIAKTSNDHVVWLFDKAFIALTYMISFCYLFFILALRRSKDKNIIHGSVRSVHDVTQTKPSANNGNPLKK